MPYRTIAKQIPTFQSLALLGKNIELAKKKKVKLKDVIGTGATTLVGISLTSATADTIAGL